MSIHFGENHFAAARAVPLFVVVDPSQRHLKTCGGLHHAKMAGVLAHCRLALRHARSQNFPIAFIRTGSRKTDRWIKGMEPRRNEMVLDRRLASLYSSPYFREAANAAGEIILAGFFDGSGCLPTVFDALGSAHRVICIGDAILTSASEQAIQHFNLQFVRSVSAPLQILSVADWISRYLRSAPSAIGRRSSPTVIPVFSKPARIQGA